MSGQPSRSRRRPTRRGHQEAPNSPPDPIAPDVLDAKATPELRELAGTLRVAEIDQLDRQALIGAIVDRAVEAGGLARRSGILDVLADGYGFLRVEGYLPSAEDAYMSRSQIDKLGLRKGDELSALVRSARGDDRHASPAVARVETVYGAPPAGLHERPRFDRLLASPPRERLQLADRPDAAIGRILDLLAPIGKGQRGLVVSQPKAGKTTVLREVARGLLHNHPEVHLIVLLVDERPEEAYTWQSTVGDRAEVVASTFDRPMLEHLQVSELVLERAKRKVERGEDVAILLDSLTRMTRSYNLAAPGTGRVLTGGVEATALDPPKRFFGAARSVEGGGSLTIVASCLVDTGSRADEVIFEEFKGRGNMEVRLDRSLAEKRLFPAVSIEGTGTRDDELLMEAEELALTWKLRRVLHALDAAEAADVLLHNIRDTQTNDEFLQKIAARLTAAR